MRSWERPISQLNFIRREFSVNPLDDPEFGGVSIRAIDFIASKNIASSAAKRLSHATSPMVTPAFIVLLLLAILAGATSLDSSLTSLSTSQDSQTQPSILTTSHFISFEEWRRHHLVNNQTVVSVSQSMSLTSAHQNSLVGSVAGDRAQAPHETNLTVSQKMLPLDSKIYKDKFNYASADCAATVVETNAQARSAASILRENKDTYLTNECAAPSKYVVIELCQDILVRLVVVGNFEFFSSMSRHFRILVSDQFPATTWQFLGEFEAKNVRDLQTFEIESPVIWARYLKLEVLSHYGSEFYCPLSLVRVHGKTMIEDFKEELPVQIAADEVLYPIQVDTGPTTISEAPGNCSVLLPHLGLNEFLSDINSTNFCDINGPHELSTAEPETTLLSLTKSTTQESIFKNIIKRLGLLESNASLSLLYIEEQSRVVSRAFSDLEQNQRSILDQLITAVNTTVMGHLHISKTMLLQQLDELAASIRVQRNQQRIALADTQARLASLAHELTLQKRFSWLNSVIVICILVYVILTRDVYIDETPHAHAENPSIRRPPLFAVGSSKRRKVGKTKKYKR